jgi:PAS domain S-box-containing protein
MEKQLSALETEAGFRALFQFATVGILVVGRSGKIELANPNAEELFGYKYAEMIGQPLEILIPEHLKRKHVGHREGYFEKPKARPMGKGMELFARKKNGDEFPVEISLGNYELEGEMLAVAFITDITERKQAVENLKKLNEKLESHVVERTLELTHALEREKELNEIKSRFVSMASHEFRTPLSTILSSIALLEKYTGNDSENEEKRRKHFDRVRASVKNLTEILEDFLSIEKLEQNKIDLSIESFDLGQLMENTKAALEGMLKPGQLISCSYQGENILMSDRRILSNVLTNLLSNAIKYSHQGGKIELHAEVNMNNVIIQVKDSGMGIPEEDQKNLFKMFHRAGNANTIQGTGLGLNIVKRYIELLNGNISFTSKLNKGSSFRIEFPKIIN